MIEKIIESFIKTDDFKKELESAPLVPDFDKYLEDNLTDEEKEKLHKNRYGIPKKKEAIKTSADLKEFYNGFPSIDSRLFQLQAEFFKEPIIDEYLKPDEKQTVTVSAISDIDKIYRDLKDSVNAPEIDRYKEPEISAKAILCLVNKMNSNCANQVVEWMLSDKDIAFQMYLWQKKDLNFPEHEYKRRWEAMKRIFDLTIKDNFRIKKSLPSKKIRDKVKLKDYLNHPLYSQLVSGLVTELQSLARKGHWMDLTTTLIESQRNGKIQKFINGGRLNKKDFLKEIMGKDYTETDYKAFDKVYPKKSEIE